MLRWVPYELILTLFDSDVSFRKSSSVISPILVPLWRYVDLFRGFSTLFKYGGVLLICNVSNECDPLSV